MGKKLVEKFFYTCLVGLSCAPCFTQRKSAWGSYTNFTKQRNVCEEWMFFLTIMPHSLALVFTQYLHVQNNLVLPAATISGAQRPAR